MIGLVLVGGEGSRLRPLTNDVPKPMLPILGRPMIARIVEHFARHGIDRVVCSLAYRADAFAAAFPSGSWAGVALVYATEPSPLDTAGAIRFAAEAAGVLDEELVVCNGDVLSGLDLSALISFHHEHSPAATVALAPVEDPSVFGVAVVEDDGAIRSFVEKPPPGTEPSKLVNVGTYVFSPGLVATIPVGRRVSVEREVFPGLAATGRLFGYASSPFWSDTGTPALYVGAQLAVLRDPSRTIEIDATEVAPGRLVAASAHVGGELRGACYIGAGAHVANGAVLTDAVVGAGATIATGTTVTASAVLDGAVIEAGATVSDSVIGARARCRERAVVRGGSVVGAGAEVGPEVLLDSARLPV